MKLTRRAGFVAGAVLAFAACKRGASSGTPAGGAIPLVEAGVVWTLPRVQTTWRMAADGTVTDLRHGATLLRIEGNLVKNAQGGVELVVEPDGKLYGGHHLDAKTADSPDASLGGTFAADDSLAIHAFATTLRVLDSGQVVAEDTGGGNQRPLPVRVDPYSPGARREALIAVFWWAGLDRQLGVLLGPSKAGKAAPPLAVAPTASAAAAPAGALHRVANPGK